MAKAKLQRSPEDMKAIVAMLACPHVWGKSRDVLVMADEKKREGKQATCTACGTHKLTWSDGTGSLFPPDGISDKPTA